jgi:hypothetical protein
MKPAIPASVSVTGTSLNTAYVTME